MSVCVSIWGGRNILKSSTAQVYNGIYQFVLYKRQSDVIFTPSH